MRPITFKLKGLAPLLMNNPEAMLTPGPKSKLGRGEYIPEEAVKVTRYLLPDGNFFVPAVAVRASLLGGAVGMKFGKTSAWSVISAAIEISDPEFPMIGENGDQMSGDTYSIDLRRVVIQKAGVPKARAKIELPWFVQCSFIYEPEMLGVEQLITVANRAGRIAGLLDYRPSKKGWFGKYEIVQESIEG